MQKSILTMNGFRLSSLSMLWEWMIAALVLGILEMLVPFFGLIFPAIAAALAGLTAAAHFGIAAQSIVFGFTTILMLTLLRPRILRRMQVPHKPMDRADACIGKIGVVKGTDKSDIFRVSVAGEDWALQSDEPLHEDVQIEIVGRDGIYLKGRLLSKKRE